MVVKTMTWEPGRKKCTGKCSGSWIPQPPKSSTPSIPSLAHLVLLPLSPLGEPQRIVFLSFNLPSINPTCRQGEGGGGR